jgi:DNA-binding CsgD family transcriptional regulator
MADEELNRLETEILTDREQEMLALYMRGKSQEVIGQQFGLTQSAVSKLIRTALKKLPQETREEAKQKDAQRLEVVAQTALQRYLDGSDKEGKLLATFLQRRASMLGYDAPTVQVTVEGGKINYSIEGVDLKEL